MRMARICRIAGSSHLLAALQRVALRTERGRLRPLWRLAYGLAARAYAAWLRGGDARISVYSRGGRDPVFGLSDIDLAVVGPAARRRAPALGGLVDAPLMLAQAELERGDSPPLYSSSPQRVRLAEKPGLYEPFTEWRLLSGQSGRLPRRRRSAQEQRAAAWLELRARWRWLLERCMRPSGPGWADDCVRAVVEPARIWIWLAHGERTDGRRGTLRRALALMPEEEPALRAALALDGSLWSAVPDDEFAGHFVRMSSRVASLLAAQVEAAGATAVQLIGDEPLTTRRSTFRLEPIVSDHASVALLPLVDWRALVGARLCMPGANTAAPPDETLAPVAA
jgi:hypothetical protein